MGFQVMNSNEPRPETALSIAFEKSEMKFWVPYNMQ